MGKIFFQTECQYPNGTYEYESSGCTDDLDFMKELFKEYMGKVREGKIARLHFEPCTLHGE